MAEKAEHPCPCTRPKLPQFRWVSKVYSNACKVLENLHTNAGILTDKECEECASKKYDWYQLCAIVVATKLPDVVQQTLDIVREQSAIEYDPSLEELTRILKVLSRLSQKKMVTEQELEDLKPAVQPWSHLVDIQCTKPPGVVTRTAELLDEVQCHREANCLRVLSTLYQEKMVTEQELEVLKPAVWPWSHLVYIQCSKPPDVVARTAELLDEMGCNSREAILLRVLSMLYQEKMVTEQEMEDLCKPAAPWLDHLVRIQCTKPPDVVTRTAELIDEVGHNEEANLLRVLAALHQKKVIAQRDLQKWKGDAQSMLLDLILDQYTKSPEDVAMTADVLGMFGCQKEAKMLILLSVLHQKKVIEHHEVEDIRHEAWRSVHHVMGPVEQHVMKVPGVGEVLCQGLVNVQSSKPKVVNATADVLDELEFKEEATQLRVLSELYQKALISEDDLRDLHRPSYHYMKGYICRHWLDSLVGIQSSKSPDVCARTFDTLRRYSLTEVGKERQSKHTGFEVSEELPSPYTVGTLEEWRRLSEDLLSKGSTKAGPFESLQTSSLGTSEELPSHYAMKTLEEQGALSVQPLIIESQLASSLEELSVSPTKTKVSSLQIGGGSDPPQREDTSIVMSDEAVLKGLCWIPFGVKTLPIEARGGTLYLQPPSDELQETKENTIFVEVPRNAVSVSANVKMRFAIISSGSFALPEGYQLGSPVVYIYYDGQHVTKPLKLHLPHWYGGEDHIRDGMSFAIASHSLEQGRRMYHFELLGGGEFPDSHCGVVEIGGHCSLFTEVFKLGVRPMYLATFLIKEERGKTECNIAVTYASLLWPQILQRRYKRGWKVLKHNPFKFQSDRITATLEKNHHVHGDWHATFTGASELPSSHVQYDCLGIDSSKLLEKAVKNSSYPPTIKCIVEYRKKLQKTGIRTLVGLHISGMDPELNFQCTAYERDQALPPTPTSLAQHTPTETGDSLSVCSPRVTSSPLDPLDERPTLKDLIEKVIVRVAGKWFTTGLQLDITSDTLDAIRTPNGSNREHCLEMFKCWLAGEQGCGDLPRTWSSVLHAVENSCGSEVCQEIMERLHKGT